LNDVHPTILSSYKLKASPMPSWDNRWLSNNDLCKIGSYPKDYNFKKLKASYLIGMSVPPVMMAQIATRVFKQWLL
jgi:DNA (cytosine-5)-methyltransferase 1